MKCLKYNPFEPSVGDRRKIIETMLYGEYKNYSNDIANVIESASFKPTQYAYFLIGHFGTGKTTILKGVLNRLLLEKHQKYKLVRDEYDVAIVEGLCTIIYYRISDSLIQDVGEISSIINLLSLITNNIYSKNFEDILSEKKCLAVMLDQLEFTTEELVRGLPKGLREIFDRSRDYSIILVSTWTPGRGLDVRIEDVIGEVKKYVGNVRDVRLYGFDRQEAVKVVQEALESARGECKVDNPFYPFTRDFIEKVLDVISDGTVNPRALYSTLGNALRIIDEYSLDLSRTADEVYLMSALFQMPYNKWMREVEKLAALPTSDMLRDAFLTFLTTLYNLKEDIIFINIDNRNIEAFKEILVDESLKTSDDVVRNLLQIASEAIDYIVFFEESPRLELIKITTRPARTHVERLKEFIDKVNEIKFGPYTIKLRVAENVKTTYRIISTRGMPKTLSNVLPLLTLYKIRWRFIRLEPAAPEDIGALFYLKNEVEKYSPSDIPPDLLNTVKYLAEKFFDIKME